MTIVIFIDDDDDGEPEWRWWFAKSCLQVHLSVISSVFSTANVNMSVRELRPKLILKITYIQLIFPLKMFKSNPAKNTIADNLDNNEIIMIMIMIRRWRWLFFYRPWREVQHVRKWRWGLVWTGSSIALTCSPKYRVWWRNTTKQFGMHT